MKENCSKEIKTMIKVILATERGKKFIQAEITGIVQEVRYSVACFLELITKLEKSFAPILPQFRLRNEITLQRFT